MKMMVKFINFAEIGEIYKFCGNGGKIYNFGEIGGIYICGNRWKFINFLEIGGNL